ncbi:MAG: arginine repressor [Pseudomonadota bacterium]
MSSVQIQRQRAIVHMLGEGPKGSDEVARLLSQAGYDVSQATVARDLEEIGAVKMKRRGKVGYTLSEKLGKRDESNERLKRIFAEWAQAVDTSGSMIVVRTPPGSAHLVALALDQAKFPEVVGTIAGDDALFVAIRSDLSPEPLASRLREMLTDH